MAQNSSPFSCTDCLYGDGCSCLKDKRHEGPIYAFKPVASNPRVLAVLGAQWGDEGKGKLVNMLAKDADVCCRFNGMCFFVCYNGLGLEQVLRTSASLYFFIRWIQCRAYDCCK